MSKYRIYHQVNRMINMVWKEPLKNCEVVTVCNILRFFAERLLVRHWLVYVFHATVPGHQLEVNQILPGMP